MSESGTGIRQAETTQHLAVYYLVWRNRVNQPWQSDEVFNRFEAHQRYLALIQRGAEAYLERRQRALLPA